MRKALSILSLITVLSTSAMAAPNYNGFGSYAMQRPMAAGMHVTNTYRMNNSYSKPPVAGINYNYNQRNTNIMINNSSNETIHCNNNVGAMGGPYPPNCAE